MKDAVSVADLFGLMPPLPLEVATSISGHRTVNPSGKHTFIPLFISEEDYFKSILPKLSEQVAPELAQYITKRLQKTFKIRLKLKKIWKEIESIIGSQNASALWLDREGFSSDSMENRALITEAVFFPPTPKSLQKLVSLLTLHKIPMVPYGEGGGYNMGVTPMAPAVTISLRNIQHMGEIKPNPSHPQCQLITVGAGLPFKDLQTKLKEQGYVIRCDPNTPRASCGGIAATGSNGGRKAFEVIKGGRAIVHGGTAVGFAPSPLEQKQLFEEPFLLTSKFFGVPNPSTLAPQIQEWASLALDPDYEPFSDSPSPFSDPMATPPQLPLSLFVGAEGCTGFIYELTFEVEKPKKWKLGMRWHFHNVEAAMAVARQIKSLEFSLQPTFFEVVTGHSIRQYLIQDFPNTFSTQDEVVLFLIAEGDTPEDCQKLQSLWTHYLLNCPQEFLGTLYSTGPLKGQEAQDALDRLVKPREELPKKLRTKCKTDMEIKTPYIADVIEIINTLSTGDLKKSPTLQNVLFGHLTPRSSAILHWNIGGFDLYDEEESEKAWKHLDDVFQKSRTLNPLDPAETTTAFTGEHGVAGKAPFLWLNYLTEQEFHRLCQIKDLIDPKHLFNPETLFLTNRFSRTLRARLLATGQKALSDIWQVAQPPSLEHAADGPQGEHEAAAFAISQGKACTRCNSCKVCPVIDAQHRLASRGAWALKPKGYLPSKRDLVLFLERIAVSRVAAPPQWAKKVHDTTKTMVREAASKLKLCFYCRKCDTACPVDIAIHPMMRAFREMGGLCQRGSRIWEWILERLMGEDSFKAITYKILALGILLTAPFRKLLLLLPLPTWLKTYLAPPGFSLQHYQPHKEPGTSLQTPHGVYMGNGVDTKTLYIRYRGCMDTFGNPDATRSVDTYFSKTLQLPFWDIKKNLCCGFPFEADGLYDRARESQKVSIVEIVKTIASAKALSKQSYDRVVLFSNCPTCCESLREMSHVLKSEDIGPSLLERAGYGKNTAPFEFDVMDTAEIALELIEKNNIPIQRVSSTVGLKVPCHNTAKATQSQVALLQKHFETVNSYDKCCGLSGTGRLKHPMIGTEIASQLFEQIDKAPSPAVVSGCPSCRDGVSMQRDASGQFPKMEVSGIFQYIVAQTSLPPSP